MTIPGKEATTNDPFVASLLTSPSIDLYNKDLSALNAMQLFLVVSLEYGVLVGREGFRIGLPVGQVSCRL